MMTHEDLAKERKFRADVLARAHTLAADRAAQMTLWLGIPVVILTAVVGTSAFASLTELGKASVYLAVATGVLSISATVLAALQTFLNFNVKASEHAKVAAKLYSLGREIEEMLLEQNFKALSDIDKQLAEITETAPALSLALYTKARKHVEARLKAGERPRKPAKASVSKVTKDTSPAFNAADSPSGGVPPSNTSSPSGYASEEAMDTSKGA